MPGGGFDPYTDEPGDILYGPSDQFGLTAWSQSDQILWRWYGDFSPSHTVKTRTIQKLARTRLAHLQLRVRLGADANLGMGRHVWHEPTGEVITAITRPGHDEVWIEASNGAKEEEEKKPLYIPYLWVGARIKEGTAPCTSAEGVLSPEVHLFMWEPPDSAPESARLRSQGPGRTRAGLTTQVVGAVYSARGLACDLGMGTKPIGDASAFESPSVSAAVGSVPTTRLFRSTCDDQEIVLRGEDSFGSTDGIYVPSCCRPIETFTIFFTQQCTRYTPTCFAVSGTAVDPGTDIAGIPVGHLATDAIHYTDSGLIFSAFGISFDPEQDLDDPNPDKAWGQTIYVDPDDPVKQFDTSRPYHFFAGFVSETVPLGFPGVAPTWSLPGEVLPGNYVLKVCMSGYPCCNPFPFGKGGGGATIEIEVRLGKQPGRTLTTTFEVLVGGQSLTFKNLVPYGWFGGFALDDIRDFKSFDAGPNNPNDENNWWRDALLIDGATGGVAVEEEYWLDGKLENDQFYEIETYPGFFDKPFNVNSYPSDFCETCELECIPEPITCPGGPCSDFLYAPVETFSGTLRYPTHLIFHRAIVICIEPADGNCRVDVNPFTGEIDPYLGRNKPQRIQIVNNCSTPGPNKVGSCEPLGNGGVFNVSFDASVWSDFTAAHEWQLGDVVFITGTQSGEVFIAPEGAPEIASNIFLNSTLICPGLPDDGSPQDTRDGGPHGQLLDSLGINETACVNGVEVVTEYLGVPV